MTQHKPKPRPVPPTAVLQFVHIPKTGGAAMNRLLRGVYGDTYFRDHPRYGLDVAGLPPDSPIECISSHRARGYERDTAIGDRAFLPFTLVRHPVDRLVSLYNFTTRNEKHHWYDAVRDMSPAEFFGALPDRPRNPSLPFEEEDWAEFANGQARLITDAGERSTESEIINVVATEYLAIAPVERHDHLTSALADEFGWPETHRNAERFNESQHRLRPSDLDETLRRRIESTNSLDLALYQFAMRQPSPIMNTSTTLRNRWALARSERLDGQK